MMICEATGTLDLERYYRLPLWQQRRWLSHARNKVEGRYDAPRRGKGAREVDSLTPPSSDEMAVVAAWHAQRAAAGGA